MLTSIRIALNGVFLVVILMLGCRDEEYEIITPNPTVNTQELSDSAQVVIQENAAVDLLATTNSDISILTTFNNQLIVSGWFTEIAGIRANGIAAFDGTSWSSLGEGLPGNEDPVFQVAGLIEDIQEFNGELYVTGQFNTIGGVYSPNLARWDGENWKPVGEGINYGGGSDFLADSWSTVGGFSLEISNNELYIGGGSLDGKNMLVKWDGTQLTPVIAYPDFAASLVMITFQNSIYGAVTLGTTSTLARFDGIRWNPVSGGDWEGMASHEGKIYGRPGLWDGNQSELVDYPLQNVYNVKSAMGHLFMLGGNNTNDSENPTVLRWDGTKWSMIYEGIDGEWLSSLEEFQGNIYLGYNKISGPERVGNIVVLE